jgi:hypothetical protein
MQATLRGLSPGASYSYRVGARNDIFSWSPRFTLRAMRRFEPAAAPLRLLALCDAGEVDTARRGAMDAAAADADATPADALLQCGDIAYDLNSDGGRRGDRFLAAMQPLGAALPWLVCPGNHEVSANFSAFRNRFRGMPNAQRSESLYWSIDLGPLHLVSYNTEVYFWPAAFGVEHAQRQHAWLDADLAKADANRAAVPWILVMGHRPMYCVATGADGHCDAEHEASRQGTMTQCSKADGHACAPLPGAPAGLSVETLLYKHGVDVAMFGHVHAYARSWPVFNEKTTPGAEAYTDPRATVHFTTGAAGNPEMKLGATPPPLGACSAPWCAFQAGYAPREGQSADYSYSRITVPNATHLRWEQISATLGGVIDDTWLVRTRGAPVFGVAAAARAPPPPKAPSGAAMRTPPLPKAPSGAGSGSAARPVG